MIKALISYKKRNILVDLIRFSLCCCIMLFHYLYKYGEIYETAMFFPINDVTFAVSIFFVISGFYLSYRGFVATGKSKIISIYLPYVFSLILIFLFLFIFQRLNGLSIGDLAGNVLIVPLLINKVNYVDGAHWYMVVLLMFCAFYLVINLFSSLFKRKRECVSLVCFLLVFIISFSFSFTTSNQIIFRLLRTLFNSNFIFICFGFFLKLFFEKKSKSSFVICILSFCCLCVFFVLKIDRVGLFLFLLCLSLFIYAVFKKTENKHSFFVALLGESSFFIYLLHQKIGYVFIEFFENNYHSRFLGTVLSVCFSIVIGIGLLLLWNIAKKRLFDNERK